ncbi:hypothetical protein [Mucilaginibacter polytrichastri]|uniref:Uncharacterized protein n=1 Tax=Mucilaginibacter polytrichastri TaxID=1302689 RepID=A0A1Q6A5B9_9SPHI|nr:hypothetical protein [Mucilaginibacter polytrichastri]OKS89192.1 hypothetical protein RG47T_4674 [Mucilaginibacter polytrichastri]
MVIKQIPVQKNVMNIFYIIMIVFFIIKVGIWGYQFGQWLKVH